MRVATQLLIEKARRAIQAAQTLLENGPYPDFASGRAYYAMFYICEALLEEKDLRYAKHSGVHAAFGFHYIKSGVLDAKYHRWLLNAYDQRIEGDYGIEIVSVADDAKTLIEQAAEFLSVAENYLSSIEA